MRESGSGSGDAFAARSAIDGGRRRWTGPGAACGCRPARQINVLRLRLSLSLSVSLTHSPRASCIHAYSMCCLCARPAKTHQTTRKTMFSATNGLRPTYQAATNPGKGYFCNGSFRPINKLVSLNEPGEASPGTVMRDVLCWDGKGLFVQSLYRLLHRTSSFWNEHLSCQALLLLAPAQPDTTGFRRFVLG